ncbi:gmc oxidoreductase [Phaffia rhodozyma]|uniref:Gmc oxidoreductase n=1 Tax=Phaffia rhodozyma TaxID=264483 RepID=A0A0F7SVI0_PHARH|nr:gmc oxidoreductase [Phaffia rhodozyma]
MSGYHLTEEQINKFNSDGYLVLPSFFSKSQTDGLLNRAHKLLSDFSLEGHPMTKFSTGESVDHVGDDYFLDSGDKIRYFFEEGAFDDDTKDFRSGVSKETSINKIGHALHELDDVYREFTLRNQSIKNVAKELGAHKDPKVLQSMIICKQPKIGGKVPVHNDSTFLYTDPPSAVGFWFALEKCTPTNGCLYFKPGSHKTSKVHSRFVRLPGGGTGFETLPGMEQAKKQEEEIGWDPENFVCEECDAGTLVIIHGSVAHRSEHNYSDKSRFIYTFHMIESEVGLNPSNFQPIFVLGEKNWLQPTEAMPFIDVDVQAQRARKMEIRQEIHPALAAEERKIKEIPPSLRICHAQKFLIPLLLAFRLRVRVYCLSLSALLALSLVGSTTQAAYNPNYANKALVQRSIVTDPSQLDGKSFDFLIAGGGTAGLALAARLSEWSNVTVALIEAGGDGSNFKDRIDIPGYSYLNGLTGSDYDWKYKTVAQTDALGTVKSWPRGKGLGGSSSTNGLFWSRGSVEEYDSWNTLNPNGTEDWGWEAMTAYINKAENFTAPPKWQTDYYDIPYNVSDHGTVGPIKIGYCAYMYDSVKNWVPAWVNLGKKRLDAHSGANVGVSFSPSTLNTENSTRSDSQAGYIAPLPPRSNLVILTGFQVTAISWNSTVAGNAVSNGFKFKSTAGGNEGQEYTVTANKEVILSGGTVNTPQVLQLSGVGPSSVLSNLGINVVSDLPVGYGLQDHVSTAVKFNTKAGTLTWGNLINADEAASNLELYRAGNYTGSQWSYVNEATGYVSMADIDSDYTTYVATATAALDQNIKDITSWQNIPDNVAAGYRAQYEIQNSWLGKDIGQLEIILSMLNGMNGAGIQVGLQHPYSRGSIMINSTNPFDYPAIDPNYFGMGYDVDILNKGLEWARTLGATDPMSTFIADETLPGANVTGTDLNTFIYTSSGTEYHPLGTCAMLPQSSGGVVDTTLKVYGTSNVRVVDCSIMPMQISAHLMASAYGVAEKAADMIKAAHAYVPPASVTSSTSSFVSTSASKTTTQSASASTTVATAAQAAASGSESARVSGASRSEHVSWVFALGAGAGVISWLAIW